MGNMIGNKDGLNGYTHQVFKYVICIYSLYVYMVKLKLQQIFANTHPLIYAFVAAVTNDFALTVNWYEAKIHLPNTGGMFMHNDLNWFKLYELMHKNEGFIFSLSLSLSTIFFCIQV